MPVGVRPMASKLVSQALSRAPFTCKGAEAARENDSGHDGATKGMAAKAPA
jgi:hypothetical protein